MAPFEEPVEGVVQVRSAENALDTAVERVKEVGEGLKLKWRRSRYCEDTYIVIIKYEDERYEVNLKFVPNGYQHTMSSAIDEEFRETIHRFFNSVIFY